MAMEPGFRNIKEGFTGFYIWRVEVIIVVYIEIDSFDNIVNVLISYLKSY